jgi:hypothetical protein
MTDLQTIQAFINLAMDYPDAIRHPIVADSADWDRIGDALQGWHSSILVLPDEVRACQTLRVLAEIIYIMGYERGKREAVIPQFVVYDENDADA